MHGKLKEEEERVGSSDLVALSPPLELGCATSSRFTIVDTFIHNNGVLSSHKIL